MSGHPEVVICTCRIGIPGTPCQVPHGRWLVSGEPVRRVYHKGDLPESRALWQELHGAPE